MSAIPRNQWYVAAYATDIDRELVSRTICDEPILFWRTRDGAVVANSDRCVHVEQDSLVWVWIGDPALADESRISRAVYLDSPDHTTVRGVEPLAGLTTRNDHENRSPLRTRTRSGCGQERDDG